jgi:hypothetical protein
MAYLPNRGSLRGVVEYFNPGPTVLIRFGRECPLKALDPQPTRSLRVDHVQRYSGKTGHLMLMKNEL